MTTAFFFIAGLALLYAGGEGLVRGAAAIGMRLGLSPLIAGLTIVAFATSAPELAVSVGATLNGASGLAIGNVVGSNICNITLVAGLAALVRPAELKDGVIRRDALVMIVATLLVTGLLMDGTLMRVEGSLLTVAIVAYVVLTVWHARSNRHIDPLGDFSVPLLSEHLLINLVVTVFSVGTLVLGSEWFVSASVDIAIALGVSPAVVGLSAAALGTSLPELTASLVAARHGHSDMAAGNLIGSNIFNLLLILGVTSLVRPLLNDGVGIVDFSVMITTALIATAIMMTQSRIGRREGTAMVTFYGAYLIWLIYGTRL